MQKDFTTEKRVNGVNAEIVFSPRNLCLSPSPRLDFITKFRL